MTPCLTPLARLRNDVHVLSGLDNSAIVNTAFERPLHSDERADDLHAVFGTRPERSVARPGARRARSVGDSRFRSLQIGVSQESFGGAMQKNMSWAGPDRPLPPEEIPHRLFDRLFGAKDVGWVKRKRSILDAVRQDAALLQKACRRKTRCAWTSTSRRSAISSAPSLRLPPEYQKVTPPDEDFDMKDWPRVAKIQSDLLAYALRHAADARRQLTC